MKTLSLIAALTFPFLAACAITDVTKRYNRAGEAEYFIDCSDQKMTKCYKKALEVCPKGYYLQKESQTIKGRKSGRIRGRTKHLSGSKQSYESTFKNHLIVMCK